MHLTQHYTESLRVESLVTYKLTCRHARSQHFTASFPVYKGQLVVT